MITLEWSLLDFLGIGSRDGSSYRLGLLGVGTKAEMEFRVRLLMSIVALCVVFVYDFIELYWPQRRMEAFRREYLDLRGKEWRSVLGPEIRINVMYARRHWWFPLFRVFSWRWSDGFKGADRDSSLLLCEWQGVCGRALRRREAQFVDLRGFSYGGEPFRVRWLLGNPFRLWHRQLYRTKDIKAVLCVPILLQQNRNEGHPKFVAVGTINLDTRSDVGAEYLQQKFGELAEQFGATGRLLAMLR